MAVSRYDIDIWLTPDRGPDLGPSDKIGSDIATSVKCRFLKRLRLDNSSNNCILGCGGVGVLVCFPAPYRRNVLGLYEAIPQTRTDENGSRSFTSEAHSESFLRDCGSSGGGLLTRGILPRHGKEAVWCWVMGGTIEAVFHFSPICGISRLCTRAKIRVKEGICCAVGSFTTL